MSVAKTIELTSTSTEGFEAAIRDAIAKASETVRNIAGLLTQSTRRRRIPGFRREEPRRGRSATRRR